MNREIIERFFLKQCTPEEAKQVAAFLKQNPSVLEQYLSTEELQSLVADNNLPDELWDEIWRNIKAKNKARVIALRLKRFAAAASVILLVALAIYYLIPAKQSAPQQIAQITATPTEHKTVTNTTKKIMTVVLADSSVVEISPASSIQFDAPFPVDKRDIVLEGEAKFHVAKNKKKPFTVFAGMLGTTALGTIFSVKKLRAKNSVTVKLFEGKVVIHSSDKNLNGWKDDVYLTPGMQMKFNADLKTIAVSNFDNIKTTIAAALLPKPNKDSLNDQLTFNNTVLPKVMDKLSAYYKVKIQYDSLAIDTMNFSAIITRRDSLPLLLKAIGQMNGLEVEPTDSGFTVIKH